MMRRRGGIVRMAATTAVVAGTAGAVRHHQQQKYQTEAEAQAYEQQAGRRRRTRRRRRPTRRRRPPRRSIRPRPSFRSWPSSTTRASCPTRSSPQPRPRHSGSDPATRLTRRRGSGGRFGGTGSAPFHVRDQRIAQVRSPTGPAAFSRSVRSTAPAQERRRPAQAAGADRPRVYRAPSGPSARRPRTRRGTAPRGTSR